MQVAGDVEHPNGFNKLSGLVVFDVDLSRRGLNRESARNSRRHQSLLNRGCDEADRARTAHRKAAADLDEDDSEIAVLAVGGIDDRTRHDVVAARLEHQRLPNPVMVANENFSSLGDRQMRKQRSAASDQAHRVSAGV